MQVLQAEQTLQGQGLVLWKTDLSLAHPFEMVDTLASVRSLEVLGSSELSQDSKDQQLVSARCVAVSGLAYLQDCTHQLAAHLVLVAHLG